MTSSFRSRIAVTAREVLLCSFATAFLFGQSGAPAEAGLFTLLDGNSQADFDTSSSSNAYNWTVDGTDQLYQQAFWYRLGGVAPEQSLHLLPITFELASNTNSNPALDTLNVVYSSAGQFDVEVTYRLDGGISGSGVSDIAEQIKITNHGGAPLDFHFFQYSDFEILGTAGNDSGMFVNANTVRQFEGLISMTETVATPLPNHREIDFFNNTLTRLTDALPTTLSDLPPIGVPLGPGDMTWAYQWDVVIPATGPGRTFIISKDKRLSVVPEPTTFVMLSLAVGLLCVARRER